MGEGPFPVFLCVCLGECSTPAILNLAKSGLLFEVTVEGDKLFRLHNAVWLSSLHTEAFLVVYVTVPVSKTHQGFYQKKYESLIMVF